MNRRPQVDEKVLDALYGLDCIRTPLEAAESELTARVVEMLLLSKGMQLPMASTFYIFIFQMYTLLLIREHIGNCMEKNIQSTRLKWRH